MGFGRMRKSLTKRAAKVAAPAKRILTGRKTRRPVRQRLKGGDEARTMALMSKEAYNHNRQRAKSIGSYTYQRKHSSKRRAVYSDAKSGKSIIAYRGTVLGKKDIVRDMSITRGTLGKTNEAKKQVEAYDRVKRDLGGDVAVTGHSKGGSMAAHVMTKRDTHGHVFNAGAGARDERMSSKTRERLDRNLTRHHISGDAISVMGARMSGKNVTYKAGKSPLTAHGIDNFI